MDRQHDLAARQLTPPHRTGQQKNIPAGIGALAAVALLIVLAANPSALATIGDTISGLMGP